MNKRKLLLIFLSALMIFSLAACGKSGETEAPKTEAETSKKEEVAVERAEEIANELNVAISVDPDGLDPHRTTAASTFSVTNNIYDTLVGVSEKGDRIPRLAVSWELSEDGKEITFSLEPDVKFHNGKACNAEAVKASFERLKGEESPRAKDYANIIDIQVLSDNEIKFVTETLDVELVSKFAYPWSAIVDTEVADDLKNNPVGTGPYKLKEWVPQQYLILEKNGDSKVQAAIEIVNLKTIPDAQARVLAIQSGEIDMMIVAGNQMELVQDMPGYNIVKNPSNALQLMAMNCSNEYLANPDVRRAITMAVNKDALIENVWYGLGTKIGSHYPPVLSEYVDHSEDIKYDPEGAKKLLADAGYADGFTLKMYLPKDYQHYVDAGQIIAQELQAVGINCDIEIVEWAYWLESVYQGRNYDFTVVGHTGRLDAYQWLARYKSDSPENYVNFNNPRADEILTTAPQTMDEVERANLYKELQEILADEVPALYIQSPISVMIIKDNIQGYKSYPLDITSYVDLEIK